METPEIIQNEPRKKGIFRKILGTLLWIVGIFVVLVLTLQVVFTSSMLTNIVNRYADEYVDGDVNFGEVDVNMFTAINNILMNDGCGFYRGRQILPYEHLSRFQNDLID